MNDDKQLTNPIATQEETEDLDLSTYQKWVSSVGRPKKINLRIINKISFYLRQGNSFIDSCLLAGANRNTVYDNLKQNPEYRAIIAEAWTQNKQRHIRRIQKASEKDAKHSEWWLERRYPVEFGQRKNIDFKGQMQTRIILSPSGYDPSPEQTKARRKSGKPVVFQNDRLVVLDSEMVAPETSK